MPQKIAIRVNLPTASCADQAILVLTLAGEDVVLAGVLPGTALKGTLILGMPVPSQVRILKFKRFEPTPIGRPQARVYKLASWTR